MLNDVNVATVANNADQLILSFVPGVLRSEYENNPARKMGDPLEKDHVTLLWIDLCNFSPLCSRLMKDPVSGVEKITGILNSHYDFVLSMVTDYGGQPLFFAGDGLMSAWPSHKENIAEAIEAAAACVFKIIEDRKCLDDNNKLFSLHAILAAGPWQMAELEGVQGNRLISFYGDAFSALSLASKNDAPNRLLISDAALALLGGGLKSEPVTNATSILLQSPPAPRKADHLHPQLPEEVTQTLQSYVPRTLSFPLNEEHLQWMAEIRPVTILFVRLQNNDKTPDESLNQLRQSVALARTLVQKYDGLLNQVWMDEKESNMLICFGPPPSAHIDNPERGVRLGFEIHHLLKGSHIDNSVGVSSGMAYCGILGNDVLRHYTVIGDVVNCGAHIAGVKRNEIFCDKTTYSLTNKWLNYGGQIKATIKGQKEPIVLYVPKSIVDDNGLKTAFSISIGREKEMAVLTAAFQNTMAGNHACVIIEGDSGMGKTKLLEDFAAAIASENAMVAAGLGDFVSRNTPYASLRNVVSTLLGIGHALEIGNTVDYENLVARFGNRACLLNIVLDTAIPDSEEVRTMTGTQRVQATHDFLLQLFTEDAQKQPLVLMIDDAQWVDDSTWRLIESITEKVANCLILLTFQLTDSNAEVQRLKDIGALSIVLKEMPDTDLEALICAKLEVGAISRDVSKAVLSVAKGNPFFCIELAGSLVDNELLLFANNSCSLASEAAMKGFALPETVRGAIRRRIDRLGKGSQLSLKVGSVVGTRFSENILRSIYPIAAERSAVPDYLLEVEKNGFVNGTTVDNLSGYLFHNAVTVEVAYEMTLAEQRRQLHRESAAWYENNFKDNLQPYYVRLANHWNEAGEKDKAIAYQEMEAFRLFQLGYVKEALNLGLEIAKQLGQDIPRDLPSIGQQIGENMAAIQTLMIGKTIKGLVAHKKLADSKKEQVIKLLLSIGPFAHQSQQGELFALLTILCQRLTLEYGNGASAAEVYAMYAIIYKALTGDSETAFTWSKLSLEIDKQNGYSLQSRVLFIHGWFIGLWKLPIVDLIPLAYAGAEAGFASGDIVYACFNLSLAVVLKSVCGKPLQEVVQTAAEHFVRNNNAVINAAFHLMHEEQVAKAFQGKTSNYTSLTDEKYNEEKDIASICNTDLFNQVAYYLVSKLKLNVHFGQWDEAVEWGGKCYPLLPAFASQPGEIELEQFYAMAALYKAAEPGEEATANFSTLADAGINKLTAWAKLCPDNFLHKATLLQAIREGFTGDASKAGMQFLDAAQKAKTSGFVQDCGLAYEHLVRMKKRKGLPYGDDLQAAIEVYSQWGADGKIRYLREQFSI